MQFRLKKTPKDFTGNLCMSISFLVLNGNYEVLMLAIFIKKGIKFIEPVAMKILRNHAIYFTRSWKLSSIILNESYATICHKLAFASAKSLSIYLFIYQILVYASFQII